MDIYDALRTSSSGLSAQRMRMNLISANLANVNTTRTPEGGPYRRKEVVFEARSQSRFLPRGPAVPSGPPAGRGPGRQRFSMILVRRS